MNKDTILDNTLVSNSATVLTDFLKEQFLEGYNYTGYDYDTWIKFFSWHLLTGNIYIMQRGLDLIGFVTFRPMTENQLQDRLKTWSSALSGQYLYVSAIVFDKTYHRNNIWEFMKSFAKRTYRDVKFLAYEKYPNNELIIEEI